MKYLNIIITCLVICAAGTSKAAECFGGDGSQFIVVELSNTKNEFCSRICFDANHWNSEKAQLTLLRFVIAADNGAVMPNETFSMDPARNIKRIEGQLEDGVRLGKRTQIEQAVVHAFSCNWGQSDRHCRGGSSQICD